MSKKLSLKDAFVRSTAIQEHGDTANWLAGHTATQEAVRMEPSEPYPLIQPYSNLPVQPPVSTAPLKKKATFNLDASLHQRLKIAAAMHGLEMVAIVEDALHAYLPQLDKKAG